MIDTSPLRMAAAAALLPLALAACAGGGSEPAASSAAQTGDCPTAPVDVVVSVDQWGDIVSRLGGSCATVKTLLASSSVDPHDYEPSPADAATFQGAQLVVINGGHYDEWAAKLAQSSAPDAPVVSAVELSGAPGVDADHDHDGDGQQDHAAEDHDHDHGAGVNPHVWYSPTAVTGVADAVTKELTKLAPDSADYFDKRRQEFGTSLKDYDGTIAAIKAGATGKTYAATESVFDDMAAAVGLYNRTPAGYQAAASNETDPSPADLDAFLKLLDAKGVDVLIYNTQTEGSVPEQLRSAAEGAGIPVVNVTETVAPDAKSFEAWQVGQLTALAKALGVDS